MSEQKNVAETQKGVVAAGSGITSILKMANPASRSLHAPSTAGSSPAHRYRPDIDGLRAVAVIAVVVFHYFPYWTPGGFTGVDVFFVISGFLITGIIAEEVEARRFSITSFYARRVRRIVPALVMVMVSTAAIGWFTLMADEYSELGRHMAASALFVSNLLLWQESGYFDTASHLKPLLHLWSLAVEEQFYIVWPVLLVAISRFASRYRLAILLSISLLSFVACLVATLYAPATAFYWPLTRLWELAAGGILALVTLGRPFPPGRWADLIAFTGIVLIAGGIAFVTSNSFFPGWRALFPVLGAACLIGAGPFALVNRMFLSNRLAVAIGLISYPLYLWHWPLISLANAVAAHDARYVLRGSLRGWLLLLSVALAAATYLAVERPIRRRLRGAPTTSWIAVSLPLVLVVGLGLQAAGGLPFRPADDNPRARFLQDYARIHDRDLPSAYRNECDFYDWRRTTRKDQIAYACSAPGSKGTWLLWGDSHAAALSLGLRSILPDGVALAQVASSGCRPLLGDHPDTRSAYVCDKSNAFARETIASLKPDVLIVTQRAGHEDTDWAAIARFAKEAGAHRVILVGPFPQWVVSLPQIVAKNHLHDDPSTIAIPIEPSVIETDRELSRRYGGSSDLTYVSVIDALCRDGICKVTVPGHRRINLLSYDVGHLTPDGSKFVAREVLAPFLTQGGAR